MKLNIIGKLSTKEYEIEGLDEFIHMTSTDFICSILKIKDDSEKKKVLDELYKNKSLSERNVYLKAKSCGLFNITVRDSKNVYFFLNSIGFCMKIGHKLNIKITIDAKNMRDNIQNKNGLIYRRFDGEMVLNCDYEGPAKIEYIDK